MTATATTAGVPVLGAAARSVWGKTDRRGTSPVGWLPLWRHLADTADVAGQLWDTWLSPAVRQVIADQLPGGDADARTLAVWLAGIHDVGKATPAFAIQAPALARRMGDHGLVFNEALVRADRGHARHDVAGHVVVTDWLRDHGWSDPDPYAVVVGGHHGRPPTDESLLAVHTHRLLLGDDAWAGVQRELLHWMTERSGAAAALGGWRDVALSQPAQAALTGLVIMADWIASNEAYFPYTLDTSDEVRLRAGWDELDLPQPWRPAPGTQPVDTLFATRFALPAGAPPRPVQRLATELAETMPVPGMMIIEAAMGEGKTEAALAAVEVLARRSGASGCYFALPTRATSDAMFGRLLSWLRRLPDDDPGRGARDVRLAHGKAAFNPDYDRLRAPLPTGIGEADDGPDVGVHKWLAGPKRTMLSSFVVGTIDQLLFAALRSRHLVLRHLGLAGKVVVIDEAHAYDVFMNTYLDRALEWLGAYRVPVVVLSATLPARRRAELMRAYDDGRVGRPARRERARAANLYAEVRTDERYPLVTTSTVDRGAAATACADSGRAVTVALRRLEDDLPTLTELLRDRLSDGGCALVVRNTVARVQETAAALREALSPDIPVSVAHSRFMAVDRAAKDRWLRETFGPPGSGDRPARHIVVASQVAEQSLDIDFDLLVTDLAPVDLVLQRLGRVHRHPRGARPAKVAAPAAWITGVDWSTTPPSPVSGSRRVYQDAMLLRAAAVLLAHLDGSPLRLPADIAPLTQRAYGEQPVGPPDWQPALDQARERYEDVQATKEAKARSFRLAEVAEPGTPLINWLVGGTDAADDRAAQGHVRDSDAESLEVLLLVRTPDGLVLPPWIDGGGVPVPTAVVPRWPLPRQIACCTLPLPRSMVSADVVDTVIGELEQRVDVSAWQADHWLAGELVLDVDAAGRARVGPFDLEYSPQEGLRVARGSTP